jgi:peptidoglycan/xylan/chitin deacetylase (PgdA/CDA1 family)
MKKLFLFALFGSFAFAGWHLYPKYPSYLKKRGDLVKSFYFKAHTSRKIVALTFDDGPNAHTPKIMAVLKKHHAPATFFLIGKNLRKTGAKYYKDPLFSVGMHSLTHRNFDKISAAEIGKDFADTITVFKKHGLSCKLFRTPYGVVNQNVVDALHKYKVQGVLWSNDTFDWSKKLRSHQSALDHLGPGDIILMHDHATRPAELERLIKGIQAKGYKIVPLKEIMKYRSEYF